MTITKRDVEVMRFINDFGFCEIREIEKKFSLKKPRSYKVMGRLVKAGLVIHKRVFHNQHGIFYLSRWGATYTDLPAMKNIPRNNYEHQLMIIEVYFKLMHQHPDATWISERRLKKETFMKGIGKRGHIADGILILPDQKKIAIEIELTLKGKDRLTGILRGYIKDLSIDGVWYYCSEKVRDGIGKLAADIKFIKVNSLQEFLNLRQA